MSLRLVRLIVCLHATASDPPPPSGTNNKMNTSHQTNAGGGQCKKLDICDLMRWAWAVTNCIKQTLKCSRLGSSEQREISTIHLTWDQFLASLAPNTDNELSGMLLFANYLHCNSLNRRFNDEGINNSLRWRNHRVSWVDYSDNPIQSQIHKPQRTQADISAYPEKFITTQGRNSQ